MTPKAWTSPDDLRRDLRRRWESGLVLREVAGAATMFPHRFRLTRPRVADLSGRYDDVRAWASALLAMPQVRVELSLQGARSIGRNEVPSAVWVEDIDAAVAMIAESAALETFRSIVAVAHDRVPTLMPWLANHALEALSVAPAWTRLLDVIEWLRLNPQPGIYVRQVDIPGIDTKLIERHARLLSSMLDVVLDPTAFNAAEPSFERRYGFRHVPQTVRVRALDPALALFPGTGDRHVTVTLDDFGRLSGIQRVFVTENFVNFLAFPSTANSVAVFGEGYDVGKIASASWLADVPVHYWGDIDTHGFAILDHLRSLLPHVRSLLMDHDTLFAHEAQWGEELAQVRRDLPNLHRAESDLYDDLRDNRIRPNLRFEQERTGYHLVVEAVAALIQE